MTENAPIRHNGQLSVLRFRNEFENGLGIIIQTAHKHRIDLVMNTGEVQKPHQLGHMRAAVFADIVHRVRRILDDRLAGIDLAVQNAQRIGLEPTAAGLAQLVKISAC